MLEHIVHDWDESKVLEILLNVRNTMAAGNRGVVSTVGPASVVESEAA